MTALLSSDLPHHRSNSLIVCPLAESFVTGSPGAVTPVSVIRGPDTGKRHDSPRLVSWLGRADCYPIGTNWAVGTLGLATVELVTMVGEHGVGTGRPERDSPWSRTPATEVPRSPGDSSQSHVGTEHAGVHEPVVCDISDPERHWIVTNQVEQLATRGVKGDGQDGGARDQ